MMINKAAAGSVNPDGLKKTGSEADGSPKVPQSDPDVTYHSIENGRCVRCGVAFLRYPGFVGVLVATPEGSALRTVRVPADALSHRQLHLPGMRPAFRYPSRFVPPCSTMVRPPFPPTPEVRS